MSIFASPPDAQRAIKSFIERTSCKLPETEDEYFEFVNGVYKDKDVKKQLKEQVSGLFEARAQRELVSVLWHKCTQLRKDAYKAKEGSNGNTIVGAKGIGKSTVARMFTEFSECIFDDVISVYVDFKRFTSTPLEKEGLINVLKRFLTTKRELKFAVRDEFDEPGTELFAALAQANKFLFVFIDEFDQLYRRNPNLHLSAQEILEDVSTLGSTKSGRVACFVCGSSVMLPDLVRGKGSEAMRKEFQMLQASRSNLNGTKFPTMRIYSTLPTDLDIVKIMCGESEINERVRTITFTVGATSRFVEQFLDGPREGEAFLGADSLTYGLSDAEPTADKLYYELYKAMVDVNRKTMFEPMKKGDVKEVVLSEWEFKPLSITETRNIWSKLKFDTNESKISLDECLFHLADRSKIVLNGVDRGTPSEIYPITLAVLTKHFAEQEMTPGIMDSLLNLAKTQVTPAATKALESFFSVGAKHIGDKLFTPTKAKE